MSWHNYHIKCEAMTEAEFLSEVRRVAEVYASTPGNDRGMKRHFHELRMLAQSRGQLDQADELFRQVRREHRRALDAIIERGKS